MATGMTAHSFSTTAAGEDDDFDDECPEHLVHVATVGFIAPHGEPHSPQRAYRLTAKGRRCLA